MLTVGSCLLFDWSGRLKLAHRISSCTVSCAVLPAYGLLESLTGMDSEYTYDLYTPLEHVYSDPHAETIEESLASCETRFAVGITQGTVAADEGFMPYKAKRERYFPMELMAKALAFRCLDGRATVEADKPKIVDKIGGMATLLNDTMHALVAASGLSRVLKEGSDRRWQYLDAVKYSPPRQLFIDLRSVEDEDFAGDTQENVTALIEALTANGASKCEELMLHSEYATKIPSCVSKMTGLKKLDLSGCSSLISLPDNLGEMTQLNELCLMGCTSLVSLPKSVGELTQLKELNLSFCSNLTSLPDEIRQMTSLEVLELDECDSLVDQPDLPNLNSPEQM